MKATRPLMLGMFVILTASCDKAKSDYDQCIEIDSKSNYGGAEEYCRKAVAADPNSKSGKAAAAWLANKEQQKAAQAKEAEERAKAAKAAFDANVTKYKAMSVGDRRTALIQCCEPSSPCSDQEKDAIVAAGGDADEQASLKRVIEERTPKSVSFDELKKLAETGMTVGKPYKVCAFYYPNDLPQFCKLQSNGRTCDAYLSVGDNFGTATEDKKALYDRRNKTGCFEVRMFRGGELRITALLSDTGTYPTARAAATQTKEECAAACTRTAERCKQAAADDEETMACVRAYVDDCLKGRCHVTFGGDGKQPTTVASAAPPTAGSTEPIASATPPTATRAGTNDPVELAPQDKEFVDMHGGRDWGNRCFVHLKAGHLGWAKAACNKAIDMDPASPQPRASILYNHGLIEQGFGNKSAARSYFKQSLALRPNAEVQASLDKLGE